MKLDHIKIDPTKPVVLLDLCGVIADTYLTRPSGVARLDDGLTSYVRTSPNHLGDRVFWPHWKLLKNLFELYNVQVVMVSSWVRYYLTAEDEGIVKLSSFLAYDKILGSLNTGGGAARGDAVKAFVEHHNLTKWLVIDDARMQMYSDEKFFNNRRFVHPHGRYGIGAKELEKVDYLLGGQSKGCDFLERLFELEGIEKW